MEKKMIAIDLLDVFKTGKFYNLEVGATKDWLKENFPRPDDVVDENFWKYGNLDFFFEDERLVEICSRIIDPLLGGKSFKISNWILEDNQKLTLLYVIEKLLIERIDFTTMHTIKKYMAVPSIGLDSEWYACQTSIALLNSAVYLIFQPEEPETEDFISWQSKIKLVDQNEYKLGGFSMFKDLQSFHEMLQSKNTSYNIGNPQAGS